MAVKKWEKYSVSLGKRMVWKKVTTGNMPGWCRGVMTVEASFLVSWTVFLFVFLIYLSFYSYDKCVLFQIGRAHV